MGNGRVVFVCVRVVLPPAPALSGCFVRFLLRVVLPECARRLRGERSESYGFTRCMGRKFRVGFGFWRKATVCVTRCLRRVYTLKRICQLSWHQVQQEAENRERWWERETEKISAWREKKGIKYHAAGGGSWEREKCIRVGRTLVGISRACYIVTFLVPPGPHICART